jgi:hypothetical protein
MCQKRSTTRVKVDGKTVRVDACLKDLIPLIDSLLPHQDLLGSCCGHNRYPLTIIVRSRRSGRVEELISNIIILRKRNIYRMDSNGFYYVPEVSKEVK